MVQEITPPEVKCAIIAPKYWWQSPKIRLTETLPIFGRKVPAGFLCDGASVPRFLRWLFPRFGKYLAAAVLHDHAYRLGFVWMRLESGEWGKNPVTRRKADDLFYYAARDIGVRVFGANCLWVAVRSFGWLSWKGAAVEA